MPAHMTEANTRDLHARIARLRLPILAALLRIARRIEENFEGEILISVRRGGISFIRWTETETGDVIKEELG